MQQHVHATVRPAIEIVIEDAGGSRSAYAPSVMGVAAIGDTPEECCRAMASALAAHFRFVAREDAADFARDLAATRAELEAAEHVSSKVAVGCPHIG